MLKNRHRLKNDDEFNRVYRRGRKYQTKELTMYWLWNKTVPATRFGIVVSRQISKLATTRNLLRRRLAVALGGAFAKALFQGLDIVVVAKKDIQRLNYQQIKEQIEDLGRFIKK
ncbi:MAG: ribonuclease P protein component [Candidatus Kerfeldbacteria bacterium]|nr:ribonuclease P protein component [Candidatus Kerfeldbacteria bacterium]